MVIPKIIYKIYINQQISLDDLKNHEKGKIIFDAINTFKEKNNNYEIQLYDNKKCIEYIKNNYSNEELEMYNILRPNAYKCDLMRYLILKKEGGFYSDIKNVCLVSFDEIISPNIEWFSCIEKTSNRMQNGLIACIPQHRFIDNIINKIKNNIKNRFFGNYSTDITGPSLLYNCCELNKDNLSNDKNVIFGEFDFDNNKFYYNKKEIILWKFMKNNKEKFCQGEEFIEGENNYNKLWKRKCVYNW